MLMMMIMMMMMGELLKKAGTIRQQGLVYIVGNRHSHIPD